MGVGVNCLGIGAPAAVAQLEVQAELGIKRCVSIGTAGGFQRDQQPGDIVLLTSAVSQAGPTSPIQAAGRQSVHARAAPLPRRRPTRLEICNGNL